MQPNPNIFNDRISDALESVRCDKELQVNVHEALRTH